MALTATEEAQLRELIAQQSALLNLATNESTITSKLGATKKNLGALNAATSLADADLSFVRQGTVDRNMTLGLLSDHVLANAAQPASGRAKIQSFTIAPSGSRNQSLSFTPSVNGILLVFGIINSAGENVDSIINKIQVNGVDLDSDQVTASQTAINRYNAIGGVALTIGQIITNTSTTTATNSMSASLVYLFTPTAL